MTRPTTAWLAAAAFAACTNAKPPAATATTAEPPAFACFNCHSRERLFAAKGPESGSLRSLFLANARAGLREATPVIPGQFPGYEMQAPHRGRHPADMPRDRCFGCHPVQRDGIGHGMRVYKVADPFAAGDCAASCHDWLGASIHETGPAGRTYDGTLRPAALLEQDGNPHRAVYRNGYRNPAAAGKIHVPAIAPGCGGCHSVETVSHGATPTCLSCHTWDAPTAGGGPHAIHLAVIGSTKIDDVDSPCGVCHGFAATTSTVSQAMCYNCHLSAHAPMGGDGRPQLW